MKTDKTAKKVKSLKVRQTLSDAIWDYWISVFLVLVAILTVVPFLYVLAGSFSTEQELTERAFFIIPHTISFNAYKYIMRTGEIFRGLRNSLFLTVFGTFCSLFFTSTFAYPLSKTHLRGRNLILNLVIFTMVFSGGLIPTFLVVKALGLYNHYSALILLAAISPFNMIIMKSFFANIPSELEEAALIDGYSELGVFFNIVLPLSKPVLASIGLFVAVSFWNDYFNAMIYLNDSAKETVQIVLRRIVLLATGGDQINASGFDFDQFGVPPDKAVKMAATVVATVPILCVYPFLQKYFAKGVMIGAVKG